jgi:type I restriction enzyme M protein
MAKSSMKNGKEREKKLGDFYWAYADIVRGIGIPAATYDQRIMAFMALKLLIDNNKLQFNFEYDKQFGLSKLQYKKYQGADTKATFTNLIVDIKNLGQNLNYFTQDAKYNPDIFENILTYLNHPKVFLLGAYIDELENEYLEMVLDIYTYQAHFVDYPKEQYKDLYEKTIARMKKLSGDLTGQHFTQKSIIHLMCQQAVGQVKDNKTIAIYDPASGTGSMLMESAFYFKQHTKVEQLEIYGQEIHAQTWLLSKIFLEITSLDGKQQGMKNTIAFGNTLTNPAFSKGINGDDSFDFIIANPPFGVDWKHDYDKVVENMKNGDSHFLTIKDGKKIITPRKSDGQFLFMLHILKLMQNENKRGKRAVASIISSSTLASNGGEASAESKIRRKIFDTGMLKALIEQPKAMFTNTDINSLIWFYDTEASDFIKVVKVDNAEKPLFYGHPSPQDKMKNAYSNKNIKDILLLINNKTEKKYLSKKINPNTQVQINITQEVGIRPIEDNTSITDIQNEIKAALGELNKLVNEW